MAKTQAEKDAAKKKRQEAFKRMQENTRRAREASAKTKADRANAQRKTQDRLKQERLSKTQSEQQRYANEQQNKLIDSKSTSKLLDFMDAGNSIDDLFTQEGADATSLTPYETKRLDTNSNEDGLTLEGLVETASDLEEFTAVDPTGIELETFSNVDIAGLDPDSLAADIQAKYGGLAQETGRRGSQAREIIGKEGDPLVQGFIGSDAYQSLKDDPTSITDTTIQQQLNDIGVDWKALAYGRKSNTTGDITYDKIDFNMLDEYLNSRINPLKFSSSNTEAANSVLGGLTPPISSNTVADIVGSTQTTVPTVTDPTGRTAAPPTSTKRI